MARSTPVSTAGWARGSRTARARASSATSRACSASRATASAACRSCARRPGSATTRRASGILQLLRTEPELAAVADHTRILEAAGIPHRILAPKDCLEVEPALAHAQVPFAGGLHLPADETGDCQMFTQALAEHASKRGVRFRFETTVEALEVEDDRMTGVATSAGPLERRSLRGCARQRRSPAARAARDPPPDPAGEGLLGHAPGRALRPRAARIGDGRAQQGRDHAPRQPRARRRHRRARRDRHRSPARALRHAVAHACASSSPTPASSTGRSTGRACGR